MTDKEMFQSVIYKAAADGAAKLIRGGMAFTVMLGAIAGLLWALMFQYRANEAHAKELRQEIESLREEIAECNKARGEDSARIARLETIIEQSHKNK